MKISIYFISLLTILSIFSFRISSTNNGVEANQESKIYLPIIIKSEQKPVLLGLYPTGWMGDQKVIDSQLHEISNWSGKRITIAGTFIGINADINGGIIYPLTKIYENGYTPFINIMTDFTAEEYASGKANDYITVWAKGLKQVVSDGERMAFIALMPEMNGFWVNYGNDPTHYKESIILTQEIFKLQGVPQDSIRWVFAPNGWSYPDQIFEYYYPGDEFIDIVGFSSYNFGFCPAQADWPGWISMKETVESYVKRMQILAPDKPIFLTQTGTSAFTSNGLNEDAKNQWLREGYSYLAENSNIRAIIYFNIEDEMCDLALFRTWETEYFTRYNGYKEGVQSSVFKYYTPAELKLLHLAP